MKKDASEIPDVSKQLENGRVSSSQLFKQRKELVIEHDSQEYRLRITAGGKLILTK